MKKVLAMLLVIGLASVAQAAIAKVEFVANGSPVVMAGGSVQAYTMNITLPTGAAITAVDIGYDGAKVLNSSLSGSFYQTGQYYVAFPGQDPPIMANITPLAGSPGAAALADTHWNFAAANLTVVNAATENNNWQYGMPVMMSGEGLGTYLALTAGLAGTSAGTLAAANIAVLVGTEATALPAVGTVIGTVADADGIVFDAQVVPEPATLSLLVLGGLSLIRRRR